MGPCAAQGPENRHQAESAQWYKSEVEKKKTLSCNSRAPSVSFSWSLALLTVAYNLHRLGSSTFKESEQEAGGLLQRCHRQSVISPACLCPAFTSSENVVHLVALKILNSNCICKGIPGSCYSSGVTCWNPLSPPFIVPHNNLKEVFYQAEIQFRRLIG